MVTQWRGWQVLEEDQQAREMHRRQLMEDIQEEQQDTWVPLSDWLVKGVHRYKEPIADATLLKSVRTQEEETPPPPETFYTNHQALTQVHAILARRGITYQHLETMITEYRKAKEQGLISAEDWAKYAAELEEIRLHHAQRLDMIVTWYLENYYRVFDEKLHIITRIQLTGTRVWIKPKFDE